MRFDAPVLLYGAGQEARSTRAFLKRRAPDLDVFITVDDGEADIAETIFLPPNELETAIADRRFATIVKSPGVSLYKPIFSIARNASITVTSNLNLWGEYYAQGRTVIAITGTKGKSTTATLTHDMLKAAKLDVGLAGNVGVPPLDIADKHAIVVLELSSYQTADMTFQPDLIGLTNLYPEHVDWHRTVDQYYHDKLHLLTIAPSARLSLGPQAATNPLVQRHLGNAARLLPALDEDLEDQIFATAKSSALKGQHNIENAGVAARLALAAGADEKAIIAAIKQFQPLPHRLEEHQIGGITFVDDSISTTPEATKVALAAYFGRRIALLAGGYDRQQDYNDLGRAVFEAHVPLVICLPTTGERVAEAVRLHAPDTHIVSVDNLDEAMKALLLRKSQFDTVILSPGAPSYNQFKNFQERGSAFTRLAQNTFAV